jgi:hypothetical protein
MFSIIRKTLHMEFPWHFAIKLCAKDQSQYTVL